MFTAQEWKEIRKDTKPKVMLVARNGRIEEDWPPVLEDEPDGSYRVNESGRLIRYEHSTEEEELEEEMERIMPEDGHYSLVIRRSLHSASEEKESDQRENIFRPSAGLRIKYVI